MMKKICKSIKAIFPIWCNDEIKEVKHKVESTLKEEKIEKLKNKNQELKDKIKELEDKNQELLSKLNKLKEFEELNRIFNLYNSLSLNTKNNLKNIFKNDTLMGFLVSGVQNESIKSLWDYVSYNLVNQKSDDIEKLKEIFYSLFKLNSLYSDYILDDVKVGDMFDTHQYTNISSNNYTGEIKEVIFRGFKDKRGRVIKKSIVKI